MYLVTTIIIPDVHCTGLYWHLKYPNPVLEFHLTHHPGASPLPHHGQKITSTVLENTINPKWTGVSTRRGMTLMKVALVSISGQHVLIEFMYNAIQ